MYFPQACCIVQVASHGAYALHYRYITKGGFYMEWMNRGDSQGQPTGQPHTAAPAHAAGAARSQKASLKALRGMRLAQVVMLFLITVLVVAVVAFIARGGSNKAESGYVDSKKLQAVFLNGGQVYFGNIKDLNGKFLSMSNIYYLRVNQQVQPNQSTSNSSSNDISLVKLGCELHGPTDSMVINREQVIFWENLKDDGQVAKAVAAYKQSNPGEQKCDTASSSNNSSNATTNNATSNNTSNSSSNNSSSTTKKP